MKNESEQLIQTIHFQTFNIPMHKKHSSEAVVNILRHIKSQYLESKKSFVDAFLFGALIT